MWSLCICRYARAHHHPRRASIGCSACPLDRGNPRKSANAIKKKKYDNGDGENLRRHQLAKQKGS